MKRCRPSGFVLEDNATIGEYFRSPSMATLFHRTTAERAKAILESGFRDARGFDGLDVEGVWLSDVPLDSNDFGRLDRNILLAVTIDEAELVDLEVVEEGAEGRRYREWLVPAELINAKGKVRVVPKEEDH
jgi:hypothetical protein